MAVSSAFFVTPSLDPSSSSNPSYSPTPLDSLGIRALPMNNETRRRCLLQKARCGLSESNTPDVSALDQLKNSSALDRYTRERSSIVVIGLSHHTAPLEMREKLAIPVAEWPLAIQQLCRLNHIEEAAILSTCNRMEIYVLALSRYRGVKEVTEWMSKRSGIPVSDIRQHWFLLYNRDATQHLFQVSAGLDSVVLGEGQILAQVRQCKEKVSKGLGRVIHMLFEKAITAGSRVRKETNIASGAVSVSSAAVELAFRKLTGSSAMPMVLVIGAGKMGKLVIKHLVAKGCKRIVVVNRSQENVAAIREEMSPRVEIMYKPFDGMLACAAEADVIFTSTASETPLFLKEHVEILPPASRLFVDISVPRNVGSCVAEFAQVYNVDDLKEVVAANKEERARKAIEAQGIITEVSKDFEAWRDSLLASSTITKLRGKVDRIRTGQVERFMSKYGKDMDKKMREAVKRLTESITNETLKGPMRHLRCNEHKSGTTLEEMLANKKAVDRIYELDLEVLEEKIRAKKADKKIELEGETE